MDFGGVGRSGARAVGVSELLTSLRFADDVLLVTDSRQGVQTMLEDLAVESATHGLRLHPDKYKVGTNSSLHNQKG